MQHLSPPGKARAILAGIIASFSFGGCDLLYEPSPPDAIELDYIYRNTLNGPCYLTPILIAVAEAELTRVEVVEYGELAGRWTAESYWGTSRAVPGDTIQGGAIRTVAHGGAVHFWTHYLQNDQKKAALVNMTCY